MVAIAMDVGMTGMTPRRSIARCVGIRSEEIFGGQVGFP